MSKAFPTPWTFEAEDACEDSPIKAANGEYVLVRDNGVYPPDLETCREIVDAVNERDNLRDIVWRLLPLASERLATMAAGDCDLLREARAAIGKDKGMRALRSGPCKLRATCN